MPKVRIRAGTYDASDMTDAYAVELFPVQADQRNYPWKVITPTENLREYDGQSVGIDGTRVNIGRWNGPLIFASITPLMFAYIESILFPTNGVNEDLTIVTYTSKRGWVCLNGTGHLLDPAEGGTSRAQALFLQNVALIEFNEGVEADSGGEYDASEYDASEYNIGGIPD